MRLLHARFHHGVGRPPAAQPAPDRGGDPACARQQHLPLHRLCEDHRGGAIRGRSLCARGDAMNEKPAATQIAPAHNIGDYIPMVDGPEKVSGRARYTADILAPGMLAGRIFRSPCSHGEILEVDVSQAQKLPGVKAIVTGADCDKTFGVLPVARTEHPLARGKVRYRGEPVAAVAAVDDATARKAVSLIYLKIRELPGYYTAKAALAPGAIAIHDYPPDNIERDVFFELGSVEQDFE